MKAKTIFENFDLYKPSKKKKEISKSNKMSDEGTKPLVYKNKQATLR